MRFFSTYISFLISFVVGILLYGHVSLSTHIFLLICPLILFFLNRKVAMIVLLAIVAFEVGIADRCFREEQFISKEDRVFPYLNQKIRLQGQVVSYPIPSPKRFSYIIETKRVQINDQWSDLHERILVNSRTYQSPQKGDVVELQTKLYIPAFLNDMQRIKQVHAFGTVYGDDRYTVLKEANLTSTKMREIIFEKAQNYLSPQSYGYFRAMVFGDQSFLGSGLIQRLKETGLLHLFVVSGSHIVFAWSLGFWIFRILLSGFGFFHYQKNFFRWIELGSIVFVLGFLHLINPPISTFRAVGSMVLFLILQCIKRRQHPLWSLGVIFYATLIYNPIYLFDISTQLTFAAVAGILCVGHLVKNHFIQKRELNRVQTYIVKAAAATLGAGIFTFPVLYFQFGTFYPLSLLYNLVLVPTLGFMVSFLSVASLVWALIPLSILHQIGFGALDFLFQLFEKAIFLNPNLKWMSMVNPLFSGSSAIYWILVPGGVGMAFIITQLILKKSVFEK